MVIILIKYVITNIKYKIMILSLHYLEQLSENLEKFLVMVLLS